MLVWLTLPFYDFCGFRSVAVNSVYKLQFFFYILAYSDREREFTFAKNCIESITSRCCCCDGKEKYTPLLAALCPDTFNDTVNTTKWHVPKTYSMPLTAAYLTIVKLHIIQQINSSGDGTANGKLFTTISRTYFKIRKPENLLRLAN